MLLVCLTITSELVDITVLVMCIVFLPKLKGVIFSKQFSIVLIPLLYFFCRKLIDDIEGLNIEVFLKYFIYLGLFYTLSFGHLTANQAYTTSHKSLGAILLFSGILVCGVVAMVTNSHGRLVLAGYHLTHSGLVIGFVGLFFLQPFFRAVSEASSFKALPGYSGWWLPVE